MRSGQPSITAQRVAAYRLSFDRLARPFGNPAADQRLTRDVARQAQLAPSELMRRYLAARTAFFDRVVVDALDRDVAQVVVLGAGYDGRALRYGRVGVRWWEVDHPDTQADKRARLEALGIGTPQVTFVAHDLEAPGLAAALRATGFNSDAAALVCCEGVAVYLSSDALALLLAEVRAIATPGTRLALSLSVADDDGPAADRRRRLYAALAAVGEPARSSLSPASSASLFAEGGWRRVDTSERLLHAGLVVAAPVGPLPPQRR